MTRVGKPAVLSVVCAVSLSGIAVAQDSVDLLQIPHIGLVRPFDGGEKDESHSEMNPFAWEGPLPPPRSPFGVFDPFAEPGTIFYQATKPESSSCPHCGHVSVALGSESQILGADQKPTEEKGETELCADNVQKIARNDSSTAQNRSGTSADWTGNIRLLPGEPAEVILDLMRRNGSSVVQWRWESELDLDKAPEPDQSVIPRESARDLVINLIRSWTDEASADAVAAKRATECTGANCDQAAAITESTGFPAGFFCEQRDDCPAELSDMNRAKWDELTQVRRAKDGKKKARQQALRESSRALIQLSFTLEDVGEIERADALYDLASGLRRDGRNDADIEKLTIEALQAEVQSLRQKIEGVVR